MKQCTKCHEVKSEDAFYFRRGRYLAACKACTCAIQREYAQTRGREVVAQYRSLNREQRNAARRDWYKRLRLEAIVAYGGRCSCCGIDEYAFLVFDHVDGGGMRERMRDYGGERGRSGGHRFLFWLREHGYPSHIQVLCANCNMAKYFTDAGCPHGRS